jgi:hypothetical protein
MLYFTFLHDERKGPETAQLGVCDLHRMPLILRGYAESANVQPNAVSRSEVNINSV